MGMAIATHRLLAAGYGVAVPAVHEPWDLLVYRRRRVWRCQVKATAAEGWEGTRVQLRAGRDKRLRYDAHTVDAIIAVHVVRGTLCCVPTRWLQGRTCFYFGTFSDYCDFKSLTKAKPHRR
jgi:hypothetical protein